MIHFDRQLQDLVADCIVDDKVLFMGFMRKMLCWDPEQRPTAAELVEHPWPDITRDEARIK